MAKGVKRQKFSACNHSSIISLNLLMEQLGGNGFYHQTSPSAFESAL